MVLVVFFRFFCTQTQKHTDTHTPPGLPALAGADSPDKSQQRWTWILGWMRDSASPKLQRRFKPTVALPCRLNSFAAHSCLKHMKQFFLKPGKWNGDYSDVGKLLTDFAEWLAAAFSNTPIHVNPIRKILLKTNQRGAKWFLYPGSEEPNGSSTLAARSQMVPLPWQRGAKWFFFCGAHLHKGTLFDLIMQNCSTCVNN